VEFLLSFFLNLEPLFNNLDGTLKLNLDSKIIFYHTRPGILSLFLNKMENFSSRQALLYKQQQQRQILQQKQRYNKENLTPNLHYIGNGTRFNNLRGIGQEEDEQIFSSVKVPENAPVPKKESTFWRSFFLYGAIVLFLVSLFVLTLISAIFGGINKDKDCPDCICTTPITSGISPEEAMSRLSQKDQGAIMLMDNVIGDESLRRCISQCYTNFFMCPYGVEDIGQGKTGSKNEDIEKCKEKTSIARGCSDFTTCVSECKADCPFRSKDNLFGNVCLNKFNYDLLCP
jgi:hypothetical protein